MGQQLARAIDRLGSTARVVVGLIALVTVGAIFYIVSSAGSAAYAPAFTNLDARSAGKIEAALASAKIPSKLTDGGATVAVPSASVDEAKIAITRAGIVTTGHDDYSLLDSGGLGMTTDQWNERLTRATSGTLATQIEQIQGVHSAEVNLAIPQRSVFLQDQGATTASIKVDTAGGTLSDSAIRGIVALVASAVPGLSAQNVRVVDERGDLLSSAMSQIGAETADRFAAESTYFAQRTAIAQAALDRVLGPGSSSVVVSGALNFDQTTVSQQQFGAAKGALQGKAESEVLQSNGANGGVAGIPSNIPGAPTASGAATSNYTHKLSDGTNAIDSTATDTTKAAGSPSTMTVSLALSSVALKKANATTASLVKLVQDAIGYDSRNAANTTSTTLVNQLANPVTSLKSIGVGVITPGSAKAASGGLIPAPFGGMVQPALAGLGLLAFLFIVRKSLKKRQALLGTTDASWLPALEAPPIRVDDLVQQISAPTTTAGDIATSDRKALSNRVEALASDRPTEVAAALRGWLAADQ